MMSSSSPFELILRLPGIIKGALRRTPKVDRASLAEATAALQQAPLPFLFCFGCRKVVSERPCEACPTETEVFVATTDTDRRLAVSRLVAEGDRS